MLSTEYLPLLLFVIVSTVTPGGATTLATASGANFGLRRSLPFIGGVAAGLASMAAVAATGLGALVLAVSSLQWLMKLAGSGWILWQGWKISRQLPPHLSRKTLKPLGAISALWMVWHNPKGWTMSLSAVASFASLSASPYTLAMVLSLLFGVFALISLCLWCLAGWWLAARLRHRWQWQLLNTVLALLLVLSLVPVWME